MKPEKINNGKKVISKRKLDYLLGNNSIYYFNDLESYYEFEEFIKLHRAPLLAKLEKASHIYLLNERYFLIIQNLDIDLYEHAFFCSAITEFAKFINNSKPLMSKILENAELIKPR
jgi:hypothetical protein